MQTNALNMEKRGGGRRRRHTGRIFSRLALLALIAMLAVCGGCRQTTAEAPVETSAAAETSAGTTATSAETSAAPAETATANDAKAAQHADETTEPDADEPAQAAAIDEVGSYTSKDDVALYLHTYGRLPSNFIKKSEARALGWDAQKGNLQDVAPGMSIGGDSFGNREGLLPAASGRKYYECDIDYAGGTRGAKRIVYSDDGLIFYTEDHYASYEQLY